MVEAVRQSQASLAAKWCLEFLILTAARSGEARGAAWAEIDMDAATWTVPATRMKAHTEHRVPLCGRALAILDEAQIIDDGSGLVFPSTVRPGCPMSDMTLTVVLRRIGVADRATVHGFRSSFRDFAAECTNAPHAVMELSLAHAVGNSVEAAYARSDLFNRRRALMEQWAAYLEGTARARRSDGSGGMNGPECPCRPAPVSTDLQAKRDAFIGRYGDDAGAWDAIHWDIASTHPDGATSAYMHFKKLSGKGKPPYPAGCLAGVLDFDEMVKEASYRLFGRSTLDGHTLDHAIRPRFDAVPASDRIDEKVFAEFRFECYRHGYCLHCPTLIEHARRDGDEGKEGEQILRSLLALFDRAGEPLPLSLREWSANSRFEQPPKGARRRPRKNWLRNLFIIHTVGDSLLPDRQEPDPQRSDG